MKTIFCFENEELSLHNNIRILEKIRVLYRDAFIVLISAGDFSSCGKLLTPSCKERSGKYAEKGADLVLSLPVASVLGGYGKKEFAGAALMQRVRIQEYLVIPCTPGSEQTLNDCENFLRACAMLMFRAEPDYRHILTENLNNNLPFRDAQLRAVCDCIPEARELLSHPENRQALWLLDAMLQLYYMPDIEFITVPELNPVEKEQQSYDHFDRIAAEILTDLITNSSFETLIDISGSTPAMAAALFENKENIKTTRSFEQITRYLLPESADNTRLFLLKAILGIRKIYMQICSLHVYVPYCYVSASGHDNPGLLLQLRETSWVPLIIDTAPDQKIKKEYSYLLQADKKAEILTW